MEHDFNHLEKLDGHQGWEWDEALRRLRDDPAADAKSAARRRRLVPVPRLRPGLGRAALRDAAKPRRRGARPEAEKPYGVVYVGSNWQRWEQVRDVPRSYAPVRKTSRPGGPDRLGLEGAPGVGRSSKGSTASTRIRRCLPSTTWSVQGRRALRRGCSAARKARFAPVFHRPLFRDLGLVTGRTFETFYADTHAGADAAARSRGGDLRPAALALVPGDDVAAFLTDALARPEAYWDAVLKTRAHLARHHSFAQRFEELGSACHGAGRSGAAR